MLTMAGAAGCVRRPGASPVRRRTSRLLGLLGLLNLAAWVWALLLFHDRPLLLGTATLAWVFGLRHAVDADHIAAIDNVVRKLSAESHPAETVGLWFSLGHSTVVVLACLVIAVSAVALEGWFSVAGRIGGVAGVVVSAGFLLVIASANLVVLRRVWREFQVVSRGGQPEPGTLGRMMDGSGLLTNLLRPLLSAVTRAWHMYPVGFLFGLGFDTATEIGLLGISAREASHGLSAWQAMVFPALFAAGMALIDTADSVLMAQAYGWALINPLRKLWYNLTMTTTSVLVAILIAGLEVLGLLSDHLGLSGGFWVLVSNLNGDFGNLGFAVIGVFGLCWVSSIIAYRWQGYHHP
jgi:high-affinity nickel-transport protein